MASGCNRARVPVVGISVLVTLLEQVAKAGWAQPIAYELDGVSSELIDRNEYDEAGELARECRGTTGAPES